MTTENYPVRNFNKCELVDEFVKTLNNWHNLVDREIDLEVECFDTELRVRYENTNYILNIAYKIDSRGLYLQDDFVVEYIYTERYKGENDSVGSRVACAYLNTILDFMQDDIYNEVSQDAYFIDTDEYHERHGGLDIEAQRIV